MDIPPEFLKAAIESEAYSDALVSLYKKTRELILPDMWIMTTNTAQHCRRIKEKGKNVRTTEVLV